MRPRRLAALPDELVLEQVNVCSRGMADITANLDPKPSVSSLDALKYNLQSILNYAGFSIAVVILSSALNTPAFNYYLG